MTQEQNTTVIGNAISSYFLVFACIFFLWSKNPNINHPFVRNHVRVAFSLQMLLLLVLFVMSFRILEGFHVFGYSLNTIVTMTLCMVIFAGILYGIFKAHSGESITLGEVFQKT